MKRLHPGSCHCGAVRFEVELDLQGGTFRCNCSVCAKSRYWMAFVPSSALRFTAGEGTLRDYQFGRRTIHHLFCPSCGVKVCGRGHLEAFGGPFYAVNVACLDDVTPEELASTPVTFLDGRNDRPDRAPTVTQHL